MNISAFQAFDGKHCETTATGSLLQHIGIELSEPMLFGLGEGLSFIYWKMRTMPFPFLGGRVKPDLLTKNIALNLNLELVEQETSSRQKAWTQVKNLIDQGQPVGLKLDCFYLDYFSNPIHFAGHYVTIYGYDEQQAWLLDTRQQGGLVKTGLKSLEQARAAKGPMSSKNLCYFLKKTDAVTDLPTALLQAIRNNANSYLNPPISNIAYKGIRKTATEIIRLYREDTQAATSFGDLGEMMEKAGTGGALFRNLYRDFLKESHELLQHAALASAHKLFAEVAVDWSDVSNLFRKLSETKDISCLHQASALLKNIAAKEKNAMELLAAI